MQSKAIQLSLYHDECSVTLTEDLILPAHNEVYDNNL